MRKEVSTTKSDQSKQTYMEIFADLVIVKLRFQAIRSRLELRDGFLTPLVSLVLGDGVSDQRLQ